ncbi:Protein fmp52, mitochondrial [Tulasnella sp. 403]|nr:Protein fmp52, mitochondrial [Tulasnella sp. 403]
MATTLTNSAAQSGGKSVLLLGATGFLGKNVLPALLASNKFDRVIEAGRRVTPSETIQKYPGREKLVQKVIDFENLDAANLKGENADVVIFTFGIAYRKAESNESYVKIEKDFVLAAAKAAKTDAKDQRLVYTSGAGANESSWFMPMRNKAQTEQGLSKLGYSDFVAFRPAEFRDPTRTDRSLGNKVLRAFIDNVPGTTYMGVPVQDLARAFVKVAEDGSRSLPECARATLQTPNDKSVPPYLTTPNKGAVELANLVKKTS